MITHKLFMGQHIFSANFIMRRGRLAGRVPMYRGRPACPVPAMTDALQLKQPQRTQRSQRKTLMILPFLSAFFAFFAVKFQPPI